LHVEVGQEEPLEEHEPRTENQSCAAFQAFEYFLRLERMRSPIRFINDHNDFHLIAA